MDVPRGYCENYGRVRLGGNEELHRQFYHPAPAGNTKG